MNNITTDITEKDERQCMIGTYVTETEKKKIAEEAKRSGLSTSSYLHAKVLGITIAEETPENHLYNIEQAAKMLFISKEMVRKLCYSGKLSYLKLANRLLFSEEDLREYEEKCKVKAKTPLLPEKMFTVESVSRELYVTHQTVIRWIHSGKISAQKIGKCFMISQSELTRMLEEQKKGHIK